MKKVLIGIGIVLLLALGALPYAVGLIAEEQVTRELQSGDDPPAELVRYRRGWLSSSVELRRSLEGPRIARALRALGLPTDRPLELRTTLSLAHGPLPIAAARERFGPALLRAETETLAWQVGEHSGELDLRGDLELGYGLGIVAQARLERVDTRTPGGAAVDWQGLALDLTSAIDGTRMSLELTVKPGAIDGDAAAVDFGRLFVASRYEQSPGGLWVGGTDLRLAQASWKMPAANDPTEIRGLSVHGHANARDGRVDYDLEAELEALVQAGLERGPGQLHLTADRLDADAVSRIAGRAGAWTETGPSAQARRMQALGTVVQALPKLLRARPRLALEALSWQTGQGRLEGRFDIRIPQETADAELGSPAGAQRAAAGSAHLALPPSAARAIARTISNNPEAAARLVGLRPGQIPVDGDRVLAALSARDVLRYKAGRYIVDAELADGRITVNGQALEALTGAQS